MKTVLTWALLIIVFILFIAKFVIALIISLAYLGLIVLGVLVGGALLWLLVSPSKSKNKNG